MKPLYKKALDHYYFKFTGRPILSRAPGRINLIGEHTDYNLGHVFPAAIDKEIVFALSQRNDQKAVIYSIDLEEDVSFELEGFQKDSSGWKNYIKGVLDQLQKAGYSLGGFQGIFTGDIPIGAGLSSSAALSCSLLTGLNALFELNIPPLEVVKLAQKVENEYIGLQCGIMDPYASVFGQANKAILLDCKTLEATYLNLEMGGYQWLLVNSNVHHELASSEYNTRRRECEQLVTLFRQKGYEVQNLRDLSLDQLDGKSTEIDPTIYKRGQFVLEENQRVLDLVKVFEKKQIKKVGELLYASHEGLRTLYEVSCPELDLLVDLTKELPFVPGARMMGGGFGGCTLNLVSKDRVEAFKDYISPIYQEKVGQKPDFYEVEVVDGVSII